MKPKFKSNYTYRNLSAAPVTEDVIETVGSIMIACAQEWRTMNKLYGRCASGTASRWMDSQKQV